MYQEPALRSSPSPAPLGASLRPLRIGLLGLGHVGLGTYTVLNRNQADIAGRAGRALQITQVAVRDTARARARVAPEVVVTDNVLAVATHPEVDVVVEAVGGTTLARDGVLAALRAGKHVVTANKALLAEHGTEVFATAAQHGVSVAYEGAVAVSIPIIKALREGLTANRIGWLAGILNGTSHYILSQMNDHGQDYASALAQAQALGYAEADPSLDVGGGDAAHKLTLLAANAFGTPVDVHQVTVTGIMDLQALDHGAAAALGYRIKLLGLARREAAGLVLRVAPTLIPQAHLLAQIAGPLNGVVVQGDASGPTWYFGAGAGGEPTASAVIADLVDLARALDVAPHQRVPALAYRPEALRHQPQVPADQHTSRHALRVPVPAGLSTDRVQARVTQVLSEQGLALEQQLVWTPAGHEAQVLVVTAPAPASARQVAQAALQTRGLVAVGLPVEHLD